MGVDIETYRGRIGTFKFATGNDVATLECFINFSGGLKAVFIVTCIGVILLLTTTQHLSIQNGHADEFLVSSSQSSGSVWFINMLHLIAGIEPNPGPKPFDSQNAENNGIPSAPIDVAPVSPKATSIDVHSLESLAEQSRGSTSEEYEGARALVNVAQGVSQSAAVVSDSRTGSQVQTRDSENAENDGISCATTDVVPVTTQSTPIDNRVVRLMKNVRTAFTNLSSGFLTKDNEGARTHFTVAPVVSQPTTVACDGPTGSQNKDNEGARTCTRLNVASVLSQSTTVAYDSSTGSIKITSRCTLSIHVDKANTT